MISFTANTVLRAREKEAAASLPKEEKLSFYFLYYNFLSEKLRYFVIYSRLKNQAIFFCAVPALSRYQNLDI